MTIEEIYSLFDSFKDKKILIIGDVMIDAYLFGSVGRISPEAPVPVVEVEQRDSRLGGAANVALNIKNLQAYPILCSVVGDDIRGNEFFDLLEQQHISSEGIVKSKERKTTTKFRIIGNNTQLLRVDEEDIHPLSKTDKQLLIERVKHIVENQNIDAIIFQDYDKGVMDKTFIKEITNIANNQNIPTTVDPKEKNFLYYENVTFFKPNLKELNKGMKTHHSKKELDKVTQSAEKLQQKLNSQYVMVTLSDAGVLILDMDDKKSTSHVIPAYRRKIADVSGAGDTVISVATLCLTQNLNSKDMANIANISGGLVCEEVGVVPISFDHLLEETIRIYS